MAFELKDLPYAFDALEPYIDAKTMEIHHDKHHGTYTSNLNAAVQGTILEGKSIEEVLKNISAQPVAVRNNGGGFYNHNIFWEIMTPGGAKQPEGDLLKALESAFGSYQGFKDAFTKAALTRFGSGWAWLVKQGESLVISSTPNQDNPLMDLAEIKGTPVLGVDVWEHAYYLKYQNRRPEYVDAFFNVINWDEVTKRFKG